MKKSPDPAASSNQASFFQDYADRASQWAASILSNLMTANVKNDDKFYLDFWRCVLTQVDDIDTIVALTLTCKSANKAANERAVKLLPQMAQKAMQDHFSGNVDLSRTDKVINRLLVTEFNKINVDKKPDESVKKIVEVKAKPLPMATLKRIHSIYRYLEQVELLNNCVRKCFDSETNHLFSNFWVRDAPKPPDKFQNIKHVARSMYFYAFGSGFNNSHYSSVSDVTREFEQLEQIKITPKSFLAQLTSLPQLVNHVFDNIHSLEQYEKVVSDFKEKSESLLKDIDSPDYMKAEITELKDCIYGINGVESTFSQISNMFKSLF